MKNIGEIMIVTRGRVLFGNVIFLVIETLRCTFILCTVTANRGLRLAVSGLPYKQTVQLRLTFFLAFNFFPAKTVVVLKESHGKSKKVRT